MPTQGETTEPDSHEYDAQKASLAASHVVGWLLTNPAVRHENIAAFHIACCETGESSYVELAHLVGVFSPPLWKIWVRQLGSLSPIYGKNKTCSKPPTSHANETGFALDDSKTWKIDEWTWMNHHVQSQWQNIQRSSPFIMDNKFRKFSAKNWVWNDVWAPKTDLRNLLRRVARKSRFSVSVEKNTTQYPC